MVFYDKIGFGWKKITFFETVSISLMVTGRYNNEYFGKWTRIFTMIYSLVLLHQTLRIIKLIDSIAPLMMIFYKIISDIHSLFTVMLIYGLVFSNLFWLIGKN